MEEKTKFDFGVILHLLFIIGSSILACAGALLIFLKIFGYPYLFEGITFLFLGIVDMYVMKFFLLQTQIVDSFLNIVAKTSKLNDNKDLLNTDFIYTEPIKIEITDQTTPEELEKIKDKFPGIANILETMKSQLTEDLFSKSSKKKNYELMSLNELESELEKVIAKENFEEAAIIRNHISKLK